MSWEENGKKGIALHLKTNINALWYLWINNVMSETYFKMICEGSDDKDWLYIDIVELG